MTKSVLIVGAGVTRACRTNPTGKNAPPLDTDFWTIAHRLYPERTTSLERRIRDRMGGFTDTVLSSLEASSNYLFLRAIDDPRDKTSHHGFLNLLSLLTDVLGETTNDLSVSPRSLLYRFLLSELERVDRPEDLTVITFNYDLMIERALAQITSHGRKGVFAFPGCYRLTDIEEVWRVTGCPKFGHRDFENSGVPVLKLHGSINWRSKHTSQTPSAAATVRQDRNLYVLDSAEIVDQITWRPSNRQVYMKPILVPPISGKGHFFHNQIRPLWTKARTALSRADRVVIAGYSCPPLDLEARFLISESLAANESKRAYVINPCAETAVKFLEYCDTQHLTVYSSIKKWTEDAKKYPSK